MPSPSSLLNFPNYLGVASTVPLNCPISAEISEIVDSQSDLRILLWLWVILKLLYQVLIMKLTYRHSNSPMQIPVEMICNTGCNIVRIKTTLIVSISVFTTYQQAKETEEV